VKRKELLPAALQPGDMLEVLGALNSIWERVMGNPTVGIDGVRVCTEQGTRLVISPEMKCLVRRSA
jgi:hypothetical protein